MKKKRVTDIEWGCVAESICCMNAVRLCMTLKGMVCLVVFNNQLQIEVFQVEEPE